MVVSDIHKMLLPYFNGRATKQVFVLTDEHTAQVCLPLLGDLVKDAPVLAVPSGEAAKTIDNVQRIWDYLMAHHATRQAVLINIGGGVVTDMGGFAAATYKRGIRFVNVPTTLLAMVDASTGGKTGVNYGGIKNAVGTFTMPQQTLIYPPFLHTLPAHEWLSGYAEMLKHALIANPKEWQWLLANDIETCISGQNADFAAHLAASIHIKEQIVERDPMENGLRRTLNFGHTVGHAIEEAYAQQHKPVAHGYCVLWGMVAELYLSVIKQGMPRKALQQLVSLMLECYGRPACDCEQQGELVDLMREDKKNDSPTEINFTLLHEIGVPVINQTATDSEIHEALEYLFSL